MKRPVLSALVVALAAALALPLTAGSAHAATLRVDDPRGDVRSITFDDSDDGSELPTDEAARGAGPDIASMTVTHAPRRITTTIRFHQLNRPTGDQLLAVSLRFRGSNGQRRVVDVTAFQQRPGGRMSEMTRESNGRRVCAKALRTSIDYRAKTATVSFPRRCIGAPARVRVAGGALAGAFAADSNKATFTYDDALRNGGSVDRFGSGFTRWVKRG